MNIEQWRAEHLEGGKAGEARTAVTGADARREGAAIAPELAVAGVSEREGSRQGEGGSGAGKPLGELAVLLEKAWARDAASGGSIF